MKFFRSLLLTTITTLLLLALSVGVLFAETPTMNDLSGLRGLTEEEIATYVLESLEVAGDEKAPLLPHSPRGHARLETIYGIRRSLFGEPKTVSEVIQQGAHVLGWVVSAGGNHNLSLGNAAEDSLARHWHVTPDWAFSGLQWTINLEGESGESGESRRFGFVGVTGEWEATPHNGMGDYNYFSATVEVCNQTLNACWTEVLVDRISMDSDQGRFHMGLSVIFVDGHNYIARLKDSSHVAWAMISVFNEGL